MKIRTLRFGSSIDLSGFEASLSRMSRMAKKAGNDIAGKVSGGKAAGVKPASGGKALGGVASAGPSFLKMTGAVAAGTAAYNLASTAASSLFGVIKTGIGDAMSLGESMSKVNEVFGENTGQITGFVDEMAMKFGTVKGPVLDAASTFGLMFKGAGLAGKEAADLSVKMSKLAADSESFHNVPLPEMLVAIRAGLAGESEPLRRFAVNISDASVESKIFSMGLARSKNEITEQNKVMARAALIQEGLKTASGDLERTQDSAANQSRKFSGSITNLAASIGQTMIPIIQTVLQSFNEFITWISTSFGDSKTTFGGWAAAVSDAFDWVLAVATNYQSVFTVASLYVQQALTNVGEVASALGANFGIIAEYISNNWVDLISAAIDYVGTSLSNLLDNIGRLGMGIFEFLKDPSKGLNVEFKSLSEGFKSTVAEFPELVKPQLTDMSKQIGDAMAPIGDTKKAIDAGQVKKAEAQAAAPVRAKGGPVDEAVQTLTQGRQKEITNFAEDLRKDVKSPIEKYAEGLKKLEEARRMGIIDNVELQRGVGALGKETGVSGPRQLAGAVELGSADAYSSIVGALTRGADSGMGDLAASNRRIAENTKASRMSLERIARVLGEPEPVAAI